MFPDVHRAEWINKVRIQSTTKVKLSNVCIFVLDNKANLAQRQFIHRKKDQNYSREKNQKEVRKV